MGCCHSEIQLNNIDLRDLTRKQLQGTLPAVCEDSFNDLSLSSHNPELTHTEDIHLHNINTQCTLSTSMSLQRTDFENAFLKSIIPFHHPEPQNRNFSEIVN